MAEKPEKVIKTDEDVKDRFLTCAICLDVYKSPKILPCVHTFCEKCLDDHIAKHKKQDEDYEDEEVEFPCPICYKPVKMNVVTSAGSMHNHFMFSLVDYFVSGADREKGLSCARCKENGGSGKGTNRCVDCDLVMCDTCCQMHDSFKVMKGHTTLKLSDIAEPSSKRLIQSRKIYCEQHPSEPLKFYCQTCRELICRDCFPTKHRLHESVEIKDAAKIVTNQIDEVVTSGKEKLEMVMKAMIAHNSYEKKLEGQVDDCKAAISKLQKLIHDLADDVAKNLLQQLDTIYGPEKKNIDAHTDLLQHKELGLNTSMEFLTKLQQEGHNVEIIKMETEIKKLQDDWKNMDEDCLHLQKKLEVHCETVQPTLEDMLKVNKIHVTSQWTPLKPKPEEVVYIPNLDEHELKSNELGIAENPIPYESEAHVDLKSQDDVTLIPGAYSSSKSINNAFILKDIESASNNMESNEKNCLKTVQDKNDFSYPKMSQKNPYIPYVCPPLQWPPAPPPLQYPQMDGGYLYKTPPAQMVGGYIPPLVEKVSGLSNPFSDRQVQDQKQEIVSIETTKNMYPEYVFSKKPNKTKAKRN